MRKRFLVDIPLRDGGRFVYSKRGAFAFLPPDPDLKAWAEAEIAYASLAGERPKDAPFVDQVFVRNAAESLIRRAVGDARSDAQYQTSKGIRMRFSRVVCPRLSAMNILAERAYKTARGRIERQIILDRRRQGRSA